ncbi:hypothetical protein ACFPT7_16710 [Acidicapsa dinghuensis]|uniref:PpiC domain-containing protein n=1 Tax=Acidicapsa dinghuensis TaxID=2218256 RepID=A0ABW1EKL7_9BACT|nr:hypothetical protein [Acidicapsa dinghuensis]
MESYLWRTSRWLPLICVYLVLAYSQPGQGQTGSTSQQQPSQTAIHSTAPDAMGTYPDNLVRYDNFFKYVVAEDDLIRQETQEGKQPVRARTDYSSAINISREDEQAMLAIILDAQNRRVENKKQYEEARNKFDIARQLGMSQDSSTPEPHYAGWVDSDWTILQQAWIQLKNTLGEDAFHKLDTYVDHQFVLGRSVTGDSAQAGGQTPFPVNVSYEMFIHHVAGEDARVKREIAEGKEQVFREDYSRAAHFPEEEEQPVLEILFETDRELVENSRQYNEAGHEFFRKYGWVGASHVPMPPELQELAEKHDRIIEEAKAKLKQELGDEYFHNLDAWIKRRYGAGKIIGGHSSASDPVAHTK